MNKVIAIIIFIIGGLLFYMLNNVWNMPTISWIVALATLALTGKFWTAD
jgi:hypothetical protein